MKWLSDLAIDHPWITMLVLLVFTAGMGMGMGRLESDADVLRDLPQNMPAKQLYDRIGETFPSKEMVFIGIESETLWTPEGLQQLDTLTRALEDVAEVQQVVSPTNATVVVGTDMGMEIRAAADPFPTTVAEAEALRDFLVTQESTSGNIVSKDGEVVAIMVFLQAKLVETESKAAGKVHDAIMANKGDLTVYPAGRPMVSYLASLQIGKEMGMLTGSAMLLMLVLLGILFFNLRGVLLPIGVVSAAVVWTMGMMGWVGIPLTHALEALPIMLIAVGVADGVHIVQAYMGRAREARNRREAARITMDDLRKPVILTSITTAIGFLALNTSGVNSIMMLGLTTAFGVLVAMIFSLTLVPAILALLPIPKASQKAEVKKSGYRLQRLMVWWGNLLVNNKKVATAIIILFVAACIAGATRVNTETSTLNNFPDDDPILIATNFFNDHFGGVTNLQVVFDGDGENALKEPAFLQRIEKFEAHVQTIEGVGGTVSVLPFLRSMNQVLHAGDEAYNRIPNEVEKETGFDYQLDEEGQEIAVPVEFEVQGRDLVSDYFSQLEMGGKPGDLANFITDDYKDAKVTVFLKSDNKKDMDRILGEVQRFMAEELDGQKVEMTGMAVLMLAVNDLMTRGQGLSILVSLALVFLVTAIVFRSVVLGFANVIPLFGAIFFNFGIMGLLGIPIDLMTMGVSSMAIGVGVDFGIHFVHRYRVSFALAGNPTDALRHTMGEAGVAILMNMVAVAGGFLTLLLASFKGVQTMGLLISLIMAFSAVGALTILPLLFTGLRPKAAETYKLPTAVVGLLIAAGIVFAGLALPRVARADDGEARTFMEEILDRNAFDDMVAKATLTMTAANGGTKVRVFKTASRDNAEGDSDMIMFMEEPADMRGNGFLMLGHEGRDDDRYLYVPALRRVNKIVGSGRGGAFMSSDFAIDDIGVPDIDEWTWTFAGEETVDGHPCKMVEGVAISDKVRKDTGYAKVVWYVDTEIKATRAADYYDKQGVKFKRMEVQEIQELNGVPFATDMTMTNLGTNHSSRMLMEEIVVNGGVEDGWFSNRALQNGF